uniref:transmembrane protein 204 n=1 Tax=Myxine glutinosa TaxID=7769 RepID=UPI00358DE936
MATTTEAAERGTLYQSPSTNGRRGPAMVLNRRLVVLAVVAACVSLVLNNAAALTAAWVRQRVEDERRRSVGLWRFCWLDPAPPGESPCQTLGWGADLSGFRESHVTVRLQFDMMRACNLIASAALMLGLLLGLLGRARCRVTPANSDWWEEAMAAMFQLACFALLIGLATFYRVGPYTQLSWSCYVQIAACLFATAAAALLLWDAMRLSEECLPRQVIVVRHAAPRRHRRCRQNEYVETPC